MTQIKLILLLALALLAAPRPPRADFILHNGVIWTVDEKNPAFRRLRLRTASSLR